MGILESQNSAIYTARERERESKIEVVAVVVAENYRARIIRKEIPRQDSYPFEKFNCVSLKVSYLCRQCCQTGLSRKTMEAILALK